jgi:hypothetical protein
MRALVLYISLLIGTVALFLLIDSHGRNLLAPEPTAYAAKEAAPTETTANPLFHVLLTLAAVVALGWMLGKLFRHVGSRR